MRDGLHVVLSLLIGMMQRKLRFVAFIALIGIAGLLYGGGFTASNIVFVTIFAFFIGLFAVLVWFWTAVFRSFITASSAPREAQSSGAQSSENAHAD